MIRRQLLSSAAAAAARPASAAAARAAPACLGSMRCAQQPRALPTTMAAQWRGMASASAAARAAGFCRRPSSAASTAAAARPLYIRALHTAGALFADQPPVTPSPPAASTTPSASPSAASSSAPPPPPPQQPRRSQQQQQQSSGRARLASKNSAYLQYLLGLTVLVVGASWASVPLYRAFCAHTGYGGTTQQDKDSSKLSTLKQSATEVVVAFNADTNPAMHWKFVPSQAEIKIKLGEPVLAFYKATNMRNKPVTGVATYNVTPQKAGFYFHKIQCFCFDEQRLRANETVDMPVFFYIDPAMEQDRRCADVTHITLSYTFFPVEDDEDDVRTEEEKMAASGFRLHGTGELPPGMVIPAGMQLPPGVTSSSPVPPPK